MNTAKQTKLNPIKIGFIKNVNLPIIPFKMQVERTSCSAPHAHPRGQLIYASKGIMKVICKQKSWIIPPSQAVWIPPNLIHDVSFPKKVLMRNLFIDESATTNLPKLCTVIKVSSLLHHLILKASKLPEQYPINSPEYRLMMVIIDELSLAEKTTLFLPLGNDKRLLKVMNILLNDINETRCLNELSKLAGASSRTIARLFIKETNLTFGTWRNRLKIQNSVRLLSEGKSISEISYLLGYNSSSAFIEMFRKNMGITPMKYFKNKYERI